MASAITDLAIKQWVQMDLKEFAQKHSLQIRRSRQDDTDNIVGRFGEIYEYDDGELALMLCGVPTGTGRWSRVRSKCIAAGMTVRQNGDDEGALSFDPANKEQAALAVKLAGARPRRRLSPKHRAKLQAANRHTQFSARHMVLNGGSNGKTASLDEAVG
jgi:hypothetical protein